MRVGELVEILSKLDQNKEIRYDSYYLLGDNEVKYVIEENHEGVEYYCITDYID